MAEINTLNWTCTQAWKASRDPSIALHPDSIAAIRKCYDYLHSKLSESDRSFYGINTGFGAFCDTIIAPGALEELQVNLIKSHACGAGETVPEEIVRLMLVLKVKSLQYGNSGVSLEAVDGLIKLFNGNFLPVIFSQGSLGASGDLAPLAHLCLPLLGTGAIWKEGQAVRVEDLDLQINYRPKAKEGLALLNGTQYMSAIGVYLVENCRRLFLQADLIAALSCDAFMCDDQPFHPSIHSVRPHRGQGEVASRIRQWREGSQMGFNKKWSVQDPYSFRCIPQVHGASLDVLKHVESVFETEINSVTDNPLIFPDEDAILSGGNFHGQPLALALDYLAIAMAEIGSISERRIFQLMSGTRGLPAFLSSKPGLESGLMIAQYLAAGVVSENKVICHPASVDTIPSSNGQEDHVSMGANGANKALRVFKNVQRILAIEVLSAWRASAFRRPLRTTDKLEELVAAIEKNADLDLGDVVHSDSIAQLERYLMHADIADH